MTRNAADLVKASLTHLDSLDHITVEWNPERYAVVWRRSSRAAPATGWGGVPPLDRLFETELFLDQSLRPAGDRDLLRVVRQLEQWMEPEAGEPRPPPVVFAWGPFRFRGRIERLDQHWMRFDADGTPVRGVLRLAMREGRAP